ncbi:CHASE domain-containing protein [Novosphingobium tardum]|uniref:histidine kinase n=1 Tax=Novosphingobium tardum TaxID=1538021 RepID=A0ABV8RLT8_9SPHN
MSLLWRASEQAVGQQQMDGIVPQRALLHHWYERFPRMLPVGIFLLTSLITVISVFAIERAESGRRNAQVNQIGQAIASTLERRANANAAYLRSGAALFATQKDVPSTLFQNFITQLRLDDDYRGAEGIGWAARVERDDITVVQDEIRRSRPRNFTIHPLPSEDQAFAVPVIFLQPETERSRLELGFNMYSDPQRRAAMQDAARYVRPTATGKVTLMHPPGTAPQTGFVIYMPVFGLSADGARQLKGYVFSPFAAADFLASARELEPDHDVGVALYDRAVAPGNLMARIPVARPSGYTAVQSLEIANHPWVVVVETGKPTRLTSLSLLTLLFGMLVASLLLVLARLVTKQATEDRIAREWLEEQQSIRNSLTRELNHRVKNTLANVLSIISLTRRRATGLDDYANSLEGRIRALSATHDLLTQSEWGTTPIRAVVAAEMAPYVQEDGRQLEITGPDVALAPNDALSLGLAVHELATNAAKYGALSVLDGRVVVSWNLLTQDLARVEWIETGGPPVSESRARGFGTDLIEKIVAHELQNPVDLRFEPGGVRCTLIIPVRRPAAFELRANRQER